MPTDDPHQQPLDNDQMLHQMVTRYVSPQEYENREYRAMWEEHAWHAMSVHCAQQGVTLIDGAVGKWEPQHNRSEEPERITSWCYRLVGWSTKPDDSDPSSQEDDRG